MPRRGLSCNKLGEVVPLYFTLLEGLKSCCGLTLTTLTTHDNLLIEENLWTPHSYYLYF